MAEFVAAVANKDLYIEKIDDFTYRCTYQTTGEVQIITFLKDKKGRHRIILIDNFSSQMIYVRQSSRLYIPSDITIINYFKRECRDLYSNSYERKIDEPIEDYLLKYFKKDFVNDYLDFIKDYIYIG